MLIAMALSSSRPVNAALVNWLAVVGVEDLRSTGAPPAW
jgi:hypothetical protein